MIQGTRTPITEGQSLLAGGPVLYGPDGRKLDPTPGMSGPDSWFGPSRPIPPREKRTDYPPREFDYPVSWNMLWSPRSEGIGPSFASLRALSVWCTPARIAIRYRKEQLRGAKWDFVPRDLDAKTPSARAQYADQIDVAAGFWRMPNRIDRLGWSGWLAQVVEEILVTDALSIFKAPDKGGGLHSLVQINGATIKPLIDPLGHIYGFQQVIKGQPNTEYTPERLMYLPYNQRVDNVYGTSPLEELLPIVNRSILRAVRDNAYYTDGMLPAGFITAPLDWSPEQVGKMQDYVDHEWTGDTMKSRIRIIPGGSGYSEAKPFVFSKDEEESINRILLAGFNVPPSALVSQVNRAAGEKSHEESVDNGLRPLQIFIKQFVDDVTQYDLGLEDIEFAWINELAGESETEAKAHAVLVGAGILTVDEARAKRGLDPINAAPDGEPGAPNASATSDVQATALNGAQVAALQSIVQSVVSGQLPAESAVPMILVAFPTITEETARAIVSPADKAEAPSATKAPVAAQPAPPEPKAEEPPPAGAVADEVSEKPGANPAAQELAQWSRFATKPERIKRQRWADPFEVRTLPPHVADGVRFALGMATSPEAVREVFRVARTRLMEAA